MKTVGLIGGMSWESTVLYYKYINEGIKNALGGLHSAKIIMSSVDFAEIAEYQSKGEWDKTAEMLCTEAKRLQKAGADFLVLCTNTMHINADHIEKAVSIPLLRITDAVAKSALDRGIKKAGLLGTAFTMEQDFYKGRMEKLGLDIITPNIEDRKRVHDVIYNELCVGVVSDKSRKKYIDIIEKLRAEGAEAVILGCTEIPLLIDQKDSPIPLLDSTKIHAEAAVEMMLRPLIKSRTSSKIVWTEKTWNPVTGCSKISDGCLNCYSEKMSHRLSLMGEQKYKNGFKVTLHHGCLSDPLRWKKGKMIFVCSMGDLFHEDVPFDFIREVFSVMSMSTQHVFQVLTKRSERLAEFAAGIQWPSNVWAGVTVENDKVKYRIDDLKKVSAPVRFLSIEPLISSLGKLELSGIDWVIVGGECGTSDRPMEKEWVDSIKDQCLQTKTPFFFKQWGGFNKKKNGRLLDSRTYDEMPFYYDQTK